MGGEEGAVVATQCADPELDDDSESAAQVRAIFVASKLAIRVARARHPNSVVLTRSFQIPCNAVYFCPWFLRADHDGRRRHACATYVFRDDRELMPTNKTSDANAVSPSAGCPSLF